MATAAITLENLADTQVCLSGLRLALKALPGTSRPQHNARLLLDAAGRHARTLRALASLPDPWGHRPNIQQAVKQMDVIRGEASRYL